MTDARTQPPLAPGLYLVATPIGNLEDITQRALRVLRTCDRIACEDTRTTGKLLQYFSITTPTVSYHVHNEHERADELIAQLKDGARIAIVSDAGTPGIADPGEAVVRAAIAAGVPVFSIPGACAAINALAGSGLPTERFIFRGFLPSKAGERKSALEIARGEMQAATAPATQIFYETPHRIAAALEDIVAVFGADHRVVLARELTKLHEEFFRGTAGAVHTTVNARESLRGEMVLMLSGDFPPAVPSASANTSVSDDIRKLLGNGIDEKEALKTVARERNMSKSDVYREWQRGSRKR